MLFVPLFMVLDQMYHSALTCATLGVLSWTCKVAYGNYSPQEHQPYNSIVKIMGGFSGAFTVIKPVLLDQNDYYIQHTLTFI